MNEEWIKEKFKNSEGRLNEHEKRIDKLEDTYSTLQTLNYRMGEVEGVVKDIGKKIDSSLQEKGNKWNKLIDYLFYFIVATILGYVAIKLGLK